jgi:hypothetical protein
VTKAHQFTTFTTPPGLQKAVGYGLGKDDTYYRSLAGDLEVKRDRFAAGELYPLLLLQARRRPRRRARSPGSLDRAAEPGHRLIDRRRVENERIKLTASFLNSIASGIAVTGAVAPLVAVYFGVPGPRQSRAITLVFGEIAWIAIAVTLRGVVP